MSTLDNTSSNQGPMGPRRHSMNRSYLLGLALAFVGALAFPSSATEPLSGVSTLLADRDFQVVPPALVVPSDGLIPLGDPPARKFWQAVPGSDDAEIQNDSGQPLVVRIKRSAFAGAGEYESSLQPRPNGVRMWVRVFFPGNLWFSFLQGDFSGVGAVAFFGEPGGYLLEFDFNEVRLQQYDYVDITTSGHAGTRWEVDAIDFLEQGADSWTRWQEFVEPTSVGSEAPSPILAVGLGQNAPNPFNPVTTIPFTLARDGPVTLDVFDVSGSHVVRLVDGELTAGSHHVTWNGTNAYGTSIPSGVYAYQLVTSDATLTKRMIVLK